MVFHAPQLSQRPDHLEKDAPHDVQVKDLGLAMRLNRPKRAGSQAPGILNDR